MEKQASTTIQPPAYEEYAQAKGGDIEARLERIQQERIRNLINTHINSLIEKQLQSGLFRAVFAFIPSDVSLLQLRGEGGACGDSLLSFPEEEFPAVVRLEGEDNTTAFWRQQPVVQKLELALRSQLGIEGSAQRQGQEQAKTTPTSPGQSSSKSSSFGFFRRQNKPSQPQTVMFSQAGAGWRADDEVPLKSSSNKSLLVAYQDVTVRIQSDLGLYQTRSCPAVVVKLRLGP